MLNERRLPAIIVLTEWRSGASDHPPQKESPRGIGPRRFSPSPRGAKYSTVTQDMSPSAVTIDVFAAIPPPHVFSAPFSL